MATIRTFAALRPTPERAPLVAAVPYDVVSADEATTLARDNPYSFLHVSRAEIDLTPNVDPYAPAVYDTAAANFRRLRQEAPLVVEDRPTLYLYRLRMGDHEQVGVAGCFSIEEYEVDVIKKHERTRPDKEDDRTRHMLALSAQTGPVFLTYRARPEVDDIVRRNLQERPLFDFVADDGVGHTVWDVPEVEIPGLAREFAQIPVLYIADGHHRAASAARARAELRSKHAAEGARVQELECDTMLAVAFPHDQVKILPYHRIIKDLGSWTPETFLSALRDRYDISEGPPAPALKGQSALFLTDRWYLLTDQRVEHRRSARTNADEVIRSLDVTALQEHLLEPILGIGDVRTDKRIDFVGGVRGTAELERLVRSGAAAVAFALYPVTVDDLMSVANAGAIMPPKSTWFEPKLRDGLLSHLI
jgi:uncharacterized protein (DUF1015 family)